MRPLVLDKIASVTRNCDLDREVRVADQYPCREGDVIAVRILNSKSTYDTLELVTGRFARLGPGDLVAGALGPRRALCGYAGHVPESLQTGDELDLLNLGGVLGHCTSHNPDVGRPFRCEVLGQVLHFPYLGQRIGEPANIRSSASGLVDDLDVGGVPVIAIVGTCMNSGKTLACTRLIQELVRRRLRVHAAKATGVSLRRDTLAMQDAGARETLSFTDLGVVTTSRVEAAGIARTLLSRLSAGRPDVIVIELGDGLMGDYGVDAILADPAVKSSLSAVVLAAGDPVGAWGGVRRLQQEFGLPVTALTGPATDNEAGTEIVERELGVPARNARVDAPGLAAVVTRSFAEEDDAEAASHAAT